MNFVSEVINIVNENDIADARVGLKKLTKEIRNFQDESKTYIRENYTEFNDAVAENNDLLGQADKLSLEAEALYKKIDVDSKDEILSVADDVQTYLMEMEELRVGLRINKRLLNIDQLFKQLENVSFVEARSIINQLREAIFDHDDKEILKQLDCYQNMKLRWHIENETLLDSMTQQLNAYFQLQEKPFQNSKCVTVKVSNETFLPTLLFMLFETTFNAQRVYTFLMKNVFEPIIRRPVSFETNLVTKDDKAASSEFNTFSLSFSTKPNIMGEINLRPNYKHVFIYMKKVFSILEKLNIILPNKKWFFGQMAEKIGDEFYGLLISECLEYAIPERIDDLRTSHLAEEVKEFDEYLKSVQFSSENNATKLIEFADKIDVIFKKRFCLGILNNAVEIMHKDLHEMQIIEESSLSGSFPRCMISRSTLELINLMQKVLQESNDLDGKSVDEYVLVDIKERLQATIPMILERYSTEIINTHGKFLQTIPQQTALFYNNCSYLAWWLSRCEINDDDPTIRFDRCEAINCELHEHGAKQFAIQISNQRKQLLEILKGFGNYQFV